MPFLFHTLLTLHLLAVISWFAGLFYLPRLFVYHAMSDDQKNQNQNQKIKAQFLIMERKLYRYIMHPAMVITLGSGYALMMMKYQSPYPLWLHVKLTLVGILFFYHWVLGYYGQQFKANFTHQKSIRSHRFFRFLNEVPTILLILILILVVFQPTYSTVTLLAKFLG